MNINALIEKIAELAGDFSAFGYDLGDIEYSASDEKPFKIFCKYSYGELMESSEKGMNMFFGNSDYIHGVPCSPDFYRALCSNLVFNCLRGEGASFSAKDDKFILRYESFAKNVSGKHHAPYEEIEIDSYGTDEISLCCNFLEICKKILRKDLDLKIRSLSDGGYKDVVRIDNCIHLIFDGAYTASRYISANRHFIVLRDEKLYIKLVEGEVGIGVENYYYSPELDALEDNAREKFLIRASPAFELTKYISAPVAETIPYNCLLRVVRYNGSPFLDKYHLAFIDYATCRAFEPQKVMAFLSEKIAVYPDLSMHKFANRYYERGRAQNNFIKKNWSIE